MESQQKSGLSPIAIAGIGCGVVALIAVVVFAGAAFFGIRKAASMAEEFANNPAAAAELIIKMNPEFDHVSTDGDGGTMTIKKKDTGEVITVNFDEIQQGNFSIQGADGQDVFSIDSDSENNGVTFRSGAEGEIKLGGAADLSDVPAWVLVYPKTLKSTTAMSRKSPAGKASGMVAFDIADDTNTISEFYRTTLKDKGYEVDEKSINNNGVTSQAIITATHAADGHQMTIMIGEANTKRTLMINYEEK